jgi:cytochrome P450
VGIATPVNGAAPPFVPLDEIDLASWDVWTHDDDFRDGAFTTLRREAPIAFHQALTQEGLVSGKGHWALTRYDDVWHVSRHPHLFSSSPSITIPDQNPKLAEFFGSMIVLDDPRHLRMRNIVSRAFTPRWWPAPKPRYANGPVDSSMQWSRSTPTGRVSWSPSSPGRCPCR